jgi:hypothetical protein
METGRTKGKEPKMKVIKTVNWEESEKYLDAWDMDIDGTERSHLYNAIEECVKEYCRDNYIRLSGSQYQHEGEHIPIVDHEGKLYAYHASMREWGGLMYDLWGDGDDNNTQSDKRGMGYCLWAWFNPDDTIHEECKRCKHGYEYNMFRADGLLNLHDHAGDPERNCRGIARGAPGSRTVWDCGKWFEDKEKEEKE